MDAGNKNKPDKNNIPENTSSQLPGTEEMAKNPNPRANENVRIRTAPPDKKEERASSGIGSEITDGEDA